MLTASNVTSTDAFMTNHLCSAIRLHHHCRLRFFFLAPTGALLIKMHNLLNFHSAKYYSITTVALNRYIFILFQCGSGKLMQLAYVSNGQHLPECPHPPFVSNHQHLPNPLWQLTLYVDNKKNECKRDLKKTATMCVGSKYLMSAP